MPGARRGYGGRGQRVCGAGGTGMVFDRDVKPGEAVFIDLNGQVHAQMCADHPVHYPVCFEYVYLARPDSVMDGISVYQARLNMGETLAVGSFQPCRPIRLMWSFRFRSLPVQCRRNWRSCWVFRIGRVLSKNRYGPHFHHAPVKVRKKSVRQKAQCDCRRVSRAQCPVGDDSIVRGTTRAPNCKWPGMPVPPGCHGQCGPTRALPQRVWH